MAGRSSANAQYKCNSLRTLLLQRFLGLLFGFGFGPFVHVRILDMFVYGDCMRMLASSMIGVKTIGPNKVNINHHNTFIILLSWLSRSRFEGSAMPSAPKCLRKV